MAYKEQARHINFTAEVHFFGNKPGVRVMMQHVRYHSMAYITTKVARALAGELIKASDHADKINAKKVRHG